MSQFPLNRRRFLQTTALGAATLSMPAVLRAQGAPVKVGILQPVSGALSYSGQQGRVGATLALEEINASGIKSLGGAKIEAVMGDAQSTPEGGNAEVEKMNAAGVCAIVGGYASGICLATTQTAARYDLPYIVDVGVTDANCTLSGPSGDTGNDGILSVGESWTYTCSTQNVVADFTNTVDVEAEACPPCRDAGACLVALTAGCPTVEDSDTKACGIASRTISAVRRSCAGFM